ncbi:ribonuclease inhibitor [Pseudonaja textilis]|uniref:ribonuclease inhibitor n=1 Tax=Pseudonaja textilis TaxID=8673 RepID=UPI000EA92684|nr:ribonuclease inhibitor [Pseudonaja textilis]
MQIMNYFFQKMIHSRLANLPKNYRPLDEGYMKHFFKSLTKLRNLKVLRLEKLSFTESCRRLLAEVFRTNQKLKELNLILEDTNDTAMRLLCKELQHPECKVETLEFQASEAAMISYCNTYLTEVFRTNQRLKELKLNLNNISDRAMEILCKGLQDPACKVEKLWLSAEAMTESCGKHIAGVFWKIRELFLVLKDSYKAFEKICEGLKHPDCKVEELRLFAKHLLQYGSTDLADVLRENKNLKTLWLWIQILEVKIVERLCEGLQHPDCKIEKLCIHEQFLSNSPSSHFVEILKRLRELQLFLCKLPENVEKVLCEGLRHLDCKVKKLRLEGKFLKESFCRSFAEILSEQTRLRELDLLSNDTNNEAVKMLCEGLKHRNCNVEKLGLGGKFLTEFFSSHLSGVFRKCQRLKELELFPINNIDTVMEVLCKGLKYSDCKLEVLRINGEYLKIFCGHSLSFGRQIASIVKTIQNLQKLYLHGDCFSDYEMKLLCEVLKSSRLNKLKELRLNGTYIMQNGEWMEMD